MMMVPSCNSSLSHPPQRFFCTDLFTKDPAIVQYCQDIWFHACLYFVCASTFGLNLGIALGLSMQWAMGVVTVVCMWGLGMPITYYFAIVRKGGLLAVWGKQANRALSAFRYWNIVKLWRVFTTQNYSNIEHPTSRCPYCIILLFSYTGSEHLASVPLDQRMPDCLLHSQGLEGSIPKDSHGTWRRGQERIGYYCGYDECCTSMNWFKK